MREIMQKALSALSQRKASQAAAAARRRYDTATSQPASAEDWGMSPEDALRANTVARYK